MNRTIALARIGDGGCKPGCFRWDHTFWQGVEQTPRAAVPLLKVGRVQGNWAAVKALGESVKAVVEAA